MPANTCLQENPPDHLPAICIYQPSDHLPAIRSSTSHLYTSHQTIYQPSKKRLPTRETTNQSMPANTCLPEDPPDYLPAIYQPSNHLPAIYQTSDYLPAVYQASDYLPTSHLPAIRPSTSHLPAIRPSTSHQTIWIIYRDISSCIVATEKESST